MQLAVRKAGDVTVIAVSGTITMLDSPSPLKQQVTALVQEGARKFVLSLGQLTFVDSSCVGELVSCYVRVARVDGTLKLSQVPRRIQRAAARHAAQRDLRILRRGFGSRRQLRVSRRSFCHVRKIPKGDCPLLYGANL